jgi:hypothetical protein
MPPEDETPKMLEQDGGTAKKGLWRADSIAQIGGEALSMSAKDSLHH